MNTALLNLFLVIILFGLVLWLVYAFIPMAYPIKQILNLLVVIVLLIYILQFFGLIKTILPMIHLLH